MRITVVVLATFTVGVLPLASASTPVSIASTAAADSRQVTAAFPTAPPARICGNAAMLSGPAAAPAGSVRVSPGQDLDTLTKAHPAGTTFWLTAGTHTLGTGEFDQVAPKSNNVYVGAPGAVLDGQRRNRYAFTQHASGVTIRYLTIQNFGVVGGNNNEGVVNHDAGAGWRVEHSTIRNNAGAGLFVGSGNVVSYNCLAANQQYGLSMYRPDGITDVTVDHNEIAGNNTYDWESRISGCGCTGGAKFWDVTGATVTSNWVHHNKGVGLWADTNDVGFRFEGNFINDNDGEGIFYEISYNAVIRNNTLKRNALVKGRSFAARGDNFPVAAIYLSESGGDSRVYGGVYATLQISGNFFEDNWSGVVMWENADRFCNSAANTSGGYCTTGGAGTLRTCVAGTIEREPYLSDCRWKTRNVLVQDNDFRMDRAAIGCTATTTSCGMQGIISNYGTFPSWSPYKGRTVQEAITFRQNNRFRNNRYAGEWRFNPYEPGRVVDSAAWQAAPYNQDTGSTFGATPLPPPPPTWQQRTRESLLGCSTTVRAANNLWQQLCLLRSAGPAAPHFWAVVVLTVTSGSPHWVAAPTVHAVKNGTTYPANGCPTTRVSSSTWLCLSHPVAFRPGQDAEQARARFDHDGVAGSYRFSPLVRLN